MTDEQLTAARVARNDATFREANERIAAVAESIGRDGLLPFICECAETTCTEIVRLSIDEYRHVRSNPRWFINALGHHVAGQGHVGVVEANDRFELVEKLGHAGELAEALEGDESLLG